MTPDAIPAERAGCHVVRELPDDLSDRSFTLAQAQSRGLTRRQLERRAVDRPWPGVYVPQTVDPSVEERCRALALRLPSTAAFSHDTALALHRLWLPSTMTGLPLHVTVPPGTTVPRPAGVRGHESILAPGDVMIVDGLRVLAPARAWASLAGSGARVEDLVVVADSLLRREGAGATAGLDLQIERWSGRRYVERLRQARGLARPGVDSAPESLIRVRFVLAGLPEPAVNRDIVDALGHWLHRPDLSWPEYRAAVDYDGAPHLSGSESRHVQDMARAERMASAGWTLRVATARDLSSGSRHLINVVRSTLIERGAPIVD